MARKKKSRRLKVINPHCAGIDIGSKEHWVAVNPDCTDQPVRCFQSFTDDLHALADWLLQLGVTDVAMEATGVYWIPLFELLEQRGLKVSLVNSRATRQVSGRKSDVLDCQWIRELMSYGLLSAAHRPSNALCELRAMVRQRQMKIRDQSRCILHMQKALAQMNIQLNHTISDLTGTTGLQILRAIVAGERDPAELARFHSKRLKASREDIEKSLRGNWRKEHLLALTQAVETWDFFGTQIQHCDQQIAERMKALALLPNHDIPDGQKSFSRDKQRTRAEQEALRQRLVQCLGVDLTAIPTIGLDTALTVLSEVGPDLSKFPSSAQFCSWLALAPPTAISGGKTLRSSRPNVINRLGQALLKAAANARNSQSYIGATHRSRIARMGCKARAIKATAHQLARLIYAMLTKGQPYVERGIAAYESESRIRQINALKRKARQYGLEVMAPIM